ncbi:MAG TPA: chromosome segregation protein SMC, partial [Bacteroidetes bacterium]|nr:chromosome segregation protein SMC [Bacteroidota bacterium]
MRLNSIYIKGFKSFYKDVLINFNENVTGIVGPNGSGKSNIVDAIRWVLGEQKPTELRLDNMSDVLFNGTEKRKKSSIAQVTITFDNTKNLLPTEYNTVAITRILYRSGESEYQINGVQCRLKDIRSLFIDTGIGSDSYAIIALNMVEDILSDTNGSRRFMFEQASGISKFKKRKKETLSKLKLTKLDLDRVEDLLFEIEGNLKELEKQARRAERYIKIRDQYKDLSIQLQLLKFDTIKASSDELKSKINSELSNYRQFETQIASLTADLEMQKNNILKSEKDLSDFQRKINQHSDELRDLENRKQLLSQKINFDENKNSLLNKEKNEIDRELIKVSDDILRFKKRIEEEKSKELQLKNKFEAIEKSYFEIKTKYEQIKANLDGIKLKKKDLEEQRLQFIKTKAILQNNIANLTQSNKQLEANSAELHKNIATKEEIKTRLETEHKELSTSLNYFVKESEEKETRIKKLTETQGEIKVKLDKIERKIDSKENELGLLKSMYDNLEGFPESIKYLSKKWNGDFPLLTDIISTSDEYKVAIETFLDPFLNYYVVDNLSQAKEAIEILRKSQKGKAHFFVLDKIKNIEKSDKSKDSLISAIDIVEYDEKYSKLVSALLKNVYISVMDLEYSLQEDDEDIIILDKTGSFISDNLSVSG